MGGAEFSPDVGGAGDAGTADAVEDCAVGGVTVDVEFVAAGAATLLVPDDAVDLVDVVGEDWKYKAVIAIWVMRGEPSAVVQLMTALSPLTDSTCTVAPAER